MVDVGGGLSRHYYEVHNDFFSQLGGIGGNLIFVSPKKLRTSYLFQDFTIFHAG